MLYFCVGVGIYVQFSSGTGSGSSSGVQPNNSYAQVDTNQSNRRSNIRFDMYCCSSSQYAIGAVIYPTNYQGSSSYTGYDHQTTYSSGDSNAGCIRFYYSYYYRRYFGLSYQGVYTCSFGNEFTSIALYSEDISSKLLIYKGEGKNSCNAEIKQYSVFYSCTYMSCVNTGFLMQQCYIIFLKDNSQLLFFFFCSVL